MADKVIWLGAKGIIAIYDDADVYVDASEGRDPLLYPTDTATLEAFRTDGQILVEAAPHKPDHAVRLQDLLTYTSAGRGREQGYGRYF